LFDYSNCTVYWPIFLVFQAQMSPISPLESSYQPCPGIGSVMASHRFVGAGGRQRIKRLQTAGAARASRVGHDGVKSLAVDIVVISAEGQARCESRLNDQQNDGLTIVFE
jgi:hypothetical protein